MEAAATQPLGHGQQVHGLDIHPLKIAPEQIQLPVAEDDLFTRLIGLAAEKPAQFPQPVQDRVISVGLG